MMAFPDVLFTQNSVPSWMGCVLSVVRGVSLISKIPPRSSATLPMYDVGGTCNPVGSDLESTMNKRTIFNFLVIVV